MRLINTRTLAFEEHFGDSIPKYAILSHTWGNEEVTYQQWLYDRHITNKKGYRKIIDCCRKARHLSIDHVWIDTNCINKDSSSELSEAINSMFAWYQSAVVCFAYIEDFHFSTFENLDGFVTSRWFERGWTLQELLAPKAMIFFDASWIEFGTKHSLLPRISRATAIHIQYLAHPESIRLASIARRMSWVATRRTTREEDMAYCMLGILEINMPLLYGEGGKAFIRLQEEIIKHNNDQTIFCWSWPLDLESTESRWWQGCLAPRPITFRDSGDYISTGVVIGDLSSDFQLTNSGLRIDMPLLVNLQHGNFQQGTRFGMLNVMGLDDNRTQICLKLDQLGTNGYRFARAGSFNRLGTTNALFRFPKAQAKGGVSVYLAHERDPNRKSSSVAIRGFGSADYPEIQYAVCPVGQNDQNIAIMFSEGRHWCFSDTYGPAVALETKDQLHPMWTKHKVRIFNGEEIELEFLLSPWNEWKVDVVVKRCDKPAMQFAVNALSEKMIKVFGKRGQTFVIPVEIPIPEPANQR